MSRSRLGWLSFATLTVMIVCLAAGIAPAQTNDVYQVNYYSHPSNTVGQDSTFHIVNPGTAVTTLDRNGVPVDGQLCANIYVFNSDEQEVECCGCELTADSEITLSLEKDLLGNPVNPRQLNNDGVIKIISGNLNGAPCDPAAETNPITPTPELRAWGTRQQSVGSTTKVVETEEGFAAAPLSTSELTFAENLCSAIQSQGSGKGICSCGYGD
jgi:hypothetical protein